MIMRRLPRGGRIRPLYSPFCQTGLTLVELMISITLGLLVVMAATALLLSTKAGYATQDESARIQETGRYAIESVARAVRQAAFENWDATQAPIVATSSFSANIMGLDAHSLKSTAPELTSPVKKSINGSDVLAVRFFGSGKGIKGDETMINCAGVGIPAAVTEETADSDRGWSIFYVAESESGEPELYCKYRGADDAGTGAKWSSQAIAHGVESFQVLYGVDIDNDGLPNQFMTATDIHALDDMLHLEGSSNEAKAIDKNKKTHWKKVVVIKVALLVRGSQNTRSDALTAIYDLFGKDYADIHADKDKGTRIKESELHKASRNRIRKIFATTIQLRNQAAGSAG